MLLDFDALEDRQRTLEADLCIVGAGAAGITLAREFQGTGRSVLVVESGDVRAEGEIQRLYDSMFSPAGRPHRSIHGGRARVFGGTTTLWGGQALPLMPIDFEARNWVRWSGWPFPGTALEPYWQRAAQVLQLGNIDFAQDIHRAFGVPRPGLDPALAEHIYSRWSPQPNFVAAYRRELAASRNVRILLHANVVQIVPGDAGTRIDRLELASLSGRRGLARAKAFVVCCGGIETARLLLASNRVEPAGIGNRRDVVGRYFQDHFSAQTGEFTPKDRRWTENLFHTFYHRRDKFFPLLSAGRSFQQRERTLNVSAAMLFESSEHDGIEQSKRVLREIKARRAHRLPWQSWKTLAANLGGVSRQAYRFLVQRRSYSLPSARVFLGSTVEQEPDPESRITLDPEYRDALGMPRTRLDWRWNPLVGHTFRAFARRLRDEFRRLDLGTVRLYPWVEADDDSWEAETGDVGHHIGSTRMHDDPGQGVVDAECRVHGLENLYLSSSSVFPTGGHSNPTFTVLLLTLRLADRLKTLLR